MADSEVRQKFEVWARSMNFISPYLLEQIFSRGDYGNGLAQVAWLAYSAGMRAGEIATKELAESVAKEVGGQFWETHMLNTGLLKFLAAIRALPLSGAEEAKKEKA